MKKKQLKLFVWDDPNVLRDFQSGLIYVLAENHLQALKLIKKKYNYAMPSFPPDSFKVIKKPEAFLCWGNG